MNTIDGSIRRITAAPRAARPHRSRSVRRVAGVAVAILVSLILAGCTGHHTSSTSAASPVVTAAPASITSPSTAPSTVAGPSPQTGPLTGDELVWLQSLGALHTTMDRTPSVLNSASMHTLAVKLGGCTRMLAGLGGPTDRLRPVYALAQQGCARYEAGSRCFVTAVKLGVVMAGSSDESKQTAAVNCGIAALGDGSKLFAEAEVKGADIQQAAH